MGTVFFDGCPSVLQHNLFHNSSTLGCTVDSNLNVFSNPLFCNSREGAVSKYTLRWDSEAAAENNAFGVLIGGQPVECAWGEIARSTKVADDVQVKVLEDVSVPVGDTLTLGEGVTILFDDDDESAAGMDTLRNELTITGTLFVDSINNPTTFTSTSGTSGDWWGIVVEDSSLAFIYDAVIENASLGLHYMSTNPYSQLYNVTFQDNEWRDLMVDKNVADPKGTFANCTLAVNGTEGLWVNAGSNLTFSNFTITGTSSGVSGVTISGGSGTTVSDATISGCTLGSGIIVKNSQSPTIEDATITNCKYGIQYEDSSSGDLKSSTIGPGTGTSSYGVRTDDTSSPAISAATTLDDHKYGLYSGGNSTPTLRGSIITDCGTGVYTGGPADPDLGTSSDHGQNSITGSTSKHVYSSRRLLPVNAEYNWWGSSNPPSSMFSNNVDYQPFLTSDPFSLYTPPEIMDKKVSISRPTLSVEPNPSISAARFQFRGLEPGTPGLVSIFDIQGRLVRNLDLQDGIAVWDNADNTGKLVAQGIYLYRVIAGNHNAVGRITVIR